MSNKGIGITFGCAVGFFGFVNAMNASNENQTDLGVIAAGCAIAAALLIGFGLLSSKRDS